MRRRAYVITAIVFVVLLIPAATLALFSYGQARAVSVRVTADRETMVGLAGTALSAKLTKLAGVISSLASSKELVTMVAAGHFDYAITLAQSVKRNPVFSDSYIARTALLDANGREMAASPAEPNNTTTTTWDTGPWKRSFDAGESFYVSGVVDVDKSFSLATDIIIVAPIISNTPHGNSIIGFALIQIPTDNFLNFDRNIVVGKFGYVYLVDQNENIIADPEKPSDAAEIVSDISDSAADLSVAGHSGTYAEQDPAENETSFVAYAPVPDYHWGIIVTEPYQEAFAASESILATMELGMALFTLLAIITMLLLFHFLANHQL